jgi:tetratricopeptide (TPR) repeat protein
VRYIAGFHHACFPTFTFSYIRCGGCGLSYRHGFHHTCIHYHAPLVYHACGSCGVRYLHGSVHTCYRPVYYIRCGRCSVSYRTTVRHVCAASPVVVTAVGAAAPVTPIELPPLEGWSMLGADQFDEALSDFDTALAGDPNRADAHVGRALALGMMGRDAEAIVAMRRAVDLDVYVLQDLPADDATRGMLGHLAETYRQQAEGAQRPVDLWFMIAALQAARRDYPAAASMLMKAVEAGDVQPSTGSLRQFIENEMAPQ